jgi:hypothetical protein
MRGRLRYIALAASVSLLGAVIFYWSDNPFRMSFVIGLCLIVTGLMLSLVSVLLALICSQRLLFRIVGLVGSTFVVLFVVLLVVFSMHYRLVAQSQLGVDEWRQDLATLRETISRVHPNAFAQVSRQEFNREFSEVETRLASDSNSQIEMSLVRLVALLQDGHSTMFPFQPAMGFHMLPIQLYGFSDGWYITEASPRYQYLVGQRVIRIGAGSVEEVYTILHPFVGADNESTVKDRIPLYMICPEALQAEGITPSATNAVVFTVADPNGLASDANIEPVGLVRYLYWYFQPLQAWKHKSDESTLPFYRQQTWKNYWFRYLGSERTVYFAFNQVRDDSRETFENFGTRLLAFCRAHPVDRLIIDIRNNSGGDNTIFRPFIRELAQSPLNRRGRLYTIIGRHTFSAAVNFTSALERETQTLFVGEPAGAGPNHFGDPHKYILPHSKLVVFLASRYHQWGDSADTRRAHEPALEVPISHSDYFANRDPVLESILRVALP